MVSETPWQDWAKKFEEEQRAKRLAAMTPDERKALVAWGEKARRKLDEEWRRLGMLAEG